MKRQLSLLLALTLCLSLTACGASEDWEGKYNELLAEHETLEADYEQLQSDYKALEKEAEALERLSISTSPVTIYTEDGDAIRLGMTQADMTAVLGEPKQDDGVDVIWYDNLFDDSLLSANFENSKAYFIGVGYDDDYYMYGDIHIGDSVDKLHEAWGQPYEQEDGWQAYLFTPVGVPLDALPEGEYIIVGFSDEGGQITSFAMELTSGETAETTVIETESSKDTETAVTETESSEDAGQIIQVNAGEWVVGEDIPAGRYTITTEDSYCIFEAQAENESFSHIYTALERGDGGYTGTLNDGDNVYCSDPVTLTPYK